MWVVVVVVDIFKKQREHNTLILMFHVKYIAVAGLNNKTSSSYCISIYVYKQFKLGNTVVLESHLLQKTSRGQSPLHQTSRLRRYIYIYIDVVCPAS